MLKKILKVIFFLLTLPVSFVLLSRKVYIMFFDWLEKYVNPCITMPVFFLLIHFALSNMGFPNELTTKGHWIFVIICMYVFMILITIMYTLEKMAEYMDKKINMLGFVRYIFLILFSLSLMYSIMYYCIYDIYPETFKNVENGNIVVVLFDFFFYSFSIMTTIGGSEIAPANILTKVLVMLEMATTFSFLVILLANYENIGKAYRGYLKDVSLKRKNGIGK